MKSKNSEETCRCPYCDAPVSRDALVCTPCQVKLVTCRACGKPKAENVRKCPHCGSEESRSSKSEND